MIPVGQRRLWRPDDHPDGPQTGDCMRACLASVFEMDYEDVPHAPGDHDIIRAWLALFTRGVGVEYRFLRPIGDREHLDDWKKWPTRHYADGYWIATVWSPRIPDVETFGCACASRVPGGDPECKWCHGKPDERSMGIRWGLHAVVAKGGRIVWDPHPDAQHDDETEWYFAGATRFVLHDPSALVPRDRSVASTPECGRDE